MFEFEKIEEDFHNRRNAELRTQNYETSDAPYSDIAGRVPRSARVIALYKRLTMEGEVGLW